MRTRGEVLHATGVRTRGEVLHATGVRTRGEVLHATGARTRGEVRPGACVSPATGVCARRGEARQNRPH
ncbi:hypothetical protein EAO70_36960, partial [Streptomyces sp. adm13(2018)]